MEPLRDLRQLGFVERAEERNGCEVVGRDHAGDANAPPARPARLVTGSQVPFCPLTSGFIGRRSVAVVPSGGFGLPKTR
jgi:hypothetical protein